MHNVPFNRVLPACVGVSFLLMLMLSFYSQENAFFQAILVVKLQYVVCFYRIILRVNQKSSNLVALNGLPNGMVLTQNGGYNQLDFGARSKCTAKGGADASSIGLLADLLSFDSSSCLECTNISQRQDMHAPPINVS